MVRILTFNTWALPAGISRQTEPRLHALIQRLPELDADVIALQEVWTASARAILREGALASGYPHSWHREAAFGGSGLMLLSRQPLIVNGAPP